MTASYYRTSYTDTTGVPRRYISLGYNSDDALTGLESHARAEEHAVANVWRIEPIEPDVAIREMGICDDG